MSGLRISGTCPTTYQSRRTGRSLGVFQAEAGDSLHICNLGVCIRLAFGNPLLFSNPWLITHKIFCETLVNGDFKVHCDGKSS